MSTHTLNYDPKERDYGRLTLVGTVTAGSWDCPRFDYEETRRNIQFIKRNSKDVRRLIAVELNAGRGYCFRKTSRTIAKTAGLKGSFSERLALVRKIFTAMIQVRVNRGISIGLQLKTNENKNAAWPAFAIDAAWQPNTPEQSALATARDRASLETNATWTL